MRRGWQIASLAFLGLSALALVQSLEFRLTDALGPGPGFFPFWLSEAASAAAAGRLTTCR